MPTDNSMARCPGTLSFGALRNPVELRLGGVNPITPRLLSAQLGSWLAEHGMMHTRDNPYHPMTQGKIGRYHRSMKNQILLENYYLPSQLSLNNLTPADI